jgi:hypothetical protein
MAKPIFVSSAFSFDSWISTQCEPLHVINIDDRCTSKQYAPDVPVSGPMDGLWIKLKYYQGNKVDGA